MNEIIICPKNKCRLGKDVESFDEYQEFFVSVKLSMLDLENRTCTYINMTYEDPIADPPILRTALMFRGPTQPNDGKEAVFIHFELTDEERDFFTVSYYLFADWDSFNQR